MEPSLKDFGFKEGELGETIMFNTHNVDLDSPVDIADVLVEEVVHFGQYYNNINDGVSPAGGTVNHEFEAKTIVGQIKARSRRKLTVAERTKLLMNLESKRSHGVPQLANGSLSNSGFQALLDTVSQGNPSLLEKLIE